MGAKRRIVVRKDDILVVNGIELDGDILREIVKPSNRLLWAFVRQGDDVRPICFSEEHCIWLLESDLTYASQGRTA